MFSPKIRWTVAIFFAILLLGIGLSEWTVFLSLIPISILFIIYFYTKPDEALPIEISRVMDQTRFQEGEHVEITLSIRNTSKKDINMLEIMDVLPMQVSLKGGSNHVITSLKKGEQTHIKYKVSCDYRGRWEIGPTHIRNRNFLDSAYTTHTMNETISDFVVIPNFEIIQDMPFRTKYPKISDGPFHSKLKGEGLDFSGIREYMNTDSLGRINWAATAKYNRLFTNEYELFRSADLLLVLDATERTASILDDQIKVVLSLCEHFLKYKCRVGLIIIRDVVDRFDLSSSRQQLVKITEKLIDVQATKVDQYNMLRKRIDTNLDKHFPLNCLTVIVSPLVNPSINTLLIEIARRRRNTFFLAPSVVASEWRFIDEKTNPANLLVHQDLIVRQKTEMTKIIQKGIIILEWDTNVPFSVFMNKLKQVSIRRGVRQ
ncbi:MAG: DUF58 domain-containing protein [Candidatus Heimdallarchaeota archaeon]